MSTPRPFGDPLADAVRKYLHDNKITQRQLTGEILADIGQRFYDHFQAQQKKRKARGDATPEEEAIYACFPKKVGRIDALAAIRSALQKVAPEVLLKATQVYGACVARWPTNYRYPQGRDICPNPATWFNQGRYLDDQKEWLPAGMFTRDDDQQNDGSPSPVARPILEPKGWSERVKASEDLAWASGRAWESLNPHYKQAIAKLCQTP